MQNISNYIKATLFFDDFSEINVKKEQGFTLQQFNYECSRKRNNMGMPYGPTQTTVLKFLIKSLPDGYLKEVYKRLDENTDSSFSIVFNAAFRSDEYGIPDKENHLYREWELQGKSVYQLLKL